MQLLKIIDKVPVLEIASQLLSLTYSYSQETLGDAVNLALTQLLGGDDWNVDK